MQVFLIGWFMLALAGLMTVIALPIVILCDFLLAAILYCVKEFFNGVVKLWKIGR